MLELLSNKLGEDKPSRKLKGGGALESRNLNLKVTQGQKGERERERDSERKRCHKL